jgi:hypothetical protein
LTEIGNPIQAPAVGWHVETIFDAAFLHP